MEDLFKIVFDENGNFMGNFSKDNIRGLLFEEDGNIRYEICNELIIYLDNHPELRYNCDAIRLYYSIEIDIITNGNYSSDIMWRGQQKGAYSAEYEFIKSDGYKTPITEKFLFENGFEIENEDDLIVKQNEYYGKTYIDKTVQYIITVTKMNLLNTCWHIHIDDEDRDSLGSLYVYSQEEFIKFVKLCRIKKELKLVK